MTYSLRAGIGLKACVMATQTYTASVFRAKGAICGWHPNRS
ncbi:MAG TPA: hypothetical protein V6C90_07715 [Coleofasciculaceae cyanobacterium]